MSDEDPHAEVGSLGEEAAKLLGALQGWARQHGDEWVEAAGHAAEGLNGAHDLDEHLATGSEDCRYCPLCQVIALARRTNPEVRRHLGDAATSMMSALSATMSTTASHGRGAHSPVERIDLDGDDAGEDD